MKLQAGVPANCVTIKRLAQGHFSSMEQWHLWRVMAPFRNQPRGFICSEFHAKCKRCFVELSVDRAKENRLQKSHFMEEDILIMEQFIPARNAKAVVGLWCGALANLDGWSSKGCGVILPQAAVVAMYRNPVESLVVVHRSHRQL